MATPQYDRVNGWDAYPAADGTANREPPFRMELFSDEQRRERGRILAQEHAARSKNELSDDSLRERLAENGKRIEAVRRELVDDATAGRAVAAVGEWLMDNYYVIEEQISLAGRHLPKKYLAELPGLPAAGGKIIPRVYDLAENVVAFGDGMVDLADVGAVVEGYQESIPLTTGELWAVPIALRLALVENLRRMAALEDGSRKSRFEAAKWAGELIRLDRDDPTDLVIAISDMARARPVLDDSFVAEFTRQLQSRGGGMKLALQWLEQRLNGEGRSADQAVTEENHVQAALEISMRNSINSLRALNVIDWSGFVEGMSAVEKTLRRDPAGVYADMDPLTRDEYRRAVSEIARKSGKSEPAVAAKCRDLAGRADAEFPERAHVGYYLVGAGAGELKAAVGFRGSLIDRIRDESSRLTLFLYLGSIGILTACFFATALLLTARHGVGHAMLAALAAPLLFCACHVAVGLVNFASTLLVRPRTLPRMDYAKGVPPEKRTLVVVPIILGGEKALRAALRNLEAHYLNNRGENLHFGLLTDFRDAAAEHASDDAALLEGCVRGVEKLNERYREDGGDNFYLFHRPRKWNGTEGVWMGRERKRGKLEDLNRLLVKGDDGAFSRIVGRRDRLPSVKYVVTLDSDTVLPRDAARQMAGSMAHILNRPRYDERLGRVVAGHGILQPRILSGLAGASRTPYSGMSAVDVGVDPYTRACSDVYQDLFDEGSFIGKGIYDVGAFDRALGGLFPDNRILSHDLLEGCVARSGLLSDVKLYEDPPAAYLTDMLRKHRWIRGDWQIAPYLFSGGVRGRNGGASTTLSLLSQWKVVDNLRRSLTPFFVLATLILGLATFSSPWLFILIVGCVFVIPVVAGAFAALVRKSPDKTFVQHLSNMAHSTAKEAKRAAFRFACLPFETLVDLDAVRRSLWRQCVSHRRLLQWIPFDVAYDKSHARRLPLLRRMWICPVLAVATGAALQRAGSAISLYALPLFLLWLAAPLMAAYVSNPRREAIDGPSPAQVDFMRKAARRIWLFFEDFVVEGENWLPPDNYQEYPAPKTAHRTSPTNIGLSLLANLSARDFGFATSGAVMKRCGKTMAALLGLPRFRGHFYNWYDTQNLEVLKPAYVSTVDSGNLAAHLLVLAAGLREIEGGGLAGREHVAGLRDAVELAAAATDNPGHPRMLAMEPLRRYAQELAKAPPETPAGLRAAFEKAELAIADILDDWPDDDGSEASARRWLSACRAQCLDVVGELDAFCPWIGEFAAHPEWRRPEFETMPSFAGIVDLEERLAADPSVPGELRRSLSDAAARARERMAEIQRLILACEDFAGIDFDFLYDENKRLLSIGYNVDERRADPGSYDLLASEARLASYLGVAMNKLPQASWFALGRALTRTDGKPLLVSWGGTMFEYLMPLLVMPTYEGTLLDATYRAVVAVQADYGAARGVPWGISESGYNVFDADNNYQYRAFGVPELGLKHGLSGDLVVAPYATMLAAMVSPLAAVENLMRMDRAGFQTSYGFYEALDYTRSRLPRGKDMAVVRSHMAHHQGMSLIALGQALFDAPMRRRFESDPRLRAATLLLQEMVPAERALYYHSTYSPEIRNESQAGGDSPMRIVRTPDSPRPEIQLLSNGRYHVMISAAGGGYSRWRDLAVTRWREDATRDNWGMFCYLRDAETGDVWSATHQPTPGMPRMFEAVFSECKAEFKRRDGDFETHVEIVVSPDDDVEVRRVKIVNRSERTRTLCLTSFAEIALARPDADDSHQAFSKLFVESSVVRDRQAVVFFRRPSRPEERNPLAFHLLAVRGTEGGPVSYETDRLAFLGRGRDASRPEAVFDDPGELGGGAGAVLDPVAAVRTSVTVKAGARVTVDLVAGVAEDWERLNLLLEKYQDERMADKAFDMACTHGQLLCRQLDLPESEAQLYCSLAGAVVYANPSLRAEGSIIRNNRQGQSGLWKYSISGDLPIVLLRVESSDGLRLVRQAMKAHRYWRRKGLAVDLVVWIDDRSGYRQALHDAVVGLAGLAVEDGDPERPGGIFVRSVERISEEDRILIQAAARVVLDEADGMIEEQLRALSHTETASSSAVIRHWAGPAPAPKPEKPPEPETVLDNGFGGFSPDGREYVIHCREAGRTPLPWVNVIANPLFGTVVSESGSAYTWNENAHEFRLTPWANDPVSDAGGEALYIRDEQTGAFWSPTPYPAADGGEYVVRHGFGYSAFEHRSDGVASETTVHVDWAAPVKFIRIKIRNESNRPRTLTVTGYVEWVLGDLRHKTAPQVVTSASRESGAIFAVNNYNDEFRGRTAFFEANDPGRTLTGDRTEFLGRNGSLARPSAMRRANLSGKAGAGLDPCGAIQVRVHLAPGGERIVVFRLGAGENAEAALKILHDTRGTETADLSLRDVRERWRELLEKIRVETPDQAFNIMANGWLLYQALSCRVWGRSATYQSGGAFGFRDQLQDSLAFLHAEPGLTRNQLLLSAAHQFVEGDAMHWWHPPAGRGVRTRCSDDFLWLPYVAERYVETTGDAGLWSEEAGYVQGRALREGEESYYDLPLRAEAVEPMYDHCRKAILRGLAFGEHGLPLMGSGDWNDGMDRVGAEGRGESVWLGFFLYSVLAGFIGPAESRGDVEFAARCRKEAETLRENLRTRAWDGAWYRRAYFDDGTPLGSAANSECRIDSVAQSWAALSGAGDADMARKAMASLDELLVDREHRLVKLFTPPFNISEPNPGYIKGYAPGVRENGGQYTHAAVWVGMAFAELGMNEKAWEILGVVNPVNHALTPEDARRYKVEPYVVSADVYAAERHAGRGGWSWYTGSASWLYRFMVESILGFTERNGAATVKPRVPAAWSGFTLRFRHGKTDYVFDCKPAPRGGGKKGGEEGSPKTRFVDDGGDHRIVVFY